MRVGSGITIVVVLGVLTGMALAAPDQQESPAVAPAAEAVVEIAFGTDIDREKRELVGESAAFTAGIEKVFCLSRILGLEAPTSVTHVWYRDGKTMARVDLNVGSSNWRTWSSKRLLPDWTGRWEVKILDSDGRVLGGGDFVVNEKQE